MATTQDRSRLRTARDRVRVELRYADGTTEIVEGPVIYYDEETGEPVTDPERIAEVERQYEEDKRCQS